MQGKNGKPEASEDASILWVRGGCDRVRFEVRYLCRKGTDCHTSVRTGSQ